MINTNSKKICPACGRPIVGFPALSRRDHKSKICSDCGLKEALEDAGMDVTVEEIKRMQKQAWKEYEERTGKKVDKFF